MECEICMKTFANIYSKKRHQTSKSCLKMKEQLIEKQGENSIKVEKLKIENENLKIENNKKCEKFKTKIIKLEKEIVNLKLASEREKAEIYKSDRDDLKECVKEIAYKPRNTTTNNIMNNLGTFDEDKVSQRCKDNIEFFTKKHFLNGQKGASDFTIEYVLKDDEGKPLYTCSDSSRKTFKRIDTKGNIVKDMEAKKLTKITYPHIAEKAQEHYTECIDNTDFNVGTNSEKIMNFLKRRNEIMMMKNDNGVYSKELGLSLE
jgi:hypothetical protein